MIAVLKDRNFSLKARIAELETAGDATAAEKPLVSSP